jgi:hypothetical protein
VFEKSQKESELTKLRRDSSGHIGRRRRSRDLFIEEENRRLENRPGKISMIAIPLRNQAQRHFAWVELIGWPKPAGEHESRHRENHAHGMSRGD